MSGPWIGAFVALSVVVFALSTLFLALARHVAALAARLPEPIPLELSQGPRVGAALADEPLPETIKRRIERLAGPQLLFVFISTTCASCRTLLSELRKFEKDVRGVSAIVIVSGASSAADPSGRVLSSEVIHDQTGVIARAFGVGTVPYALLYEAGQLRAKGIVNDRDMLTALLAAKVRADGDALLQLHAQTSASS